MPQVSPDHAESIGRVAMRITVNAAAYERPKDDFMLSPRGEIDIKGFGVQDVYYLEGEVGGRRP